RVKPMTAIPPKDGGPAPAQGEPLIYQSGEWEIDLVRRELRARAVPVPIGGRAFEIIEILVQSVGQCVSKDELMARVWRGAIVGDNTLDFHLAAVRKVLGSDRGMLKTEYGRGYRLLGTWQLRRESAPSTGPVGPERVRKSSEQFQSNIPVAA